MNNNEENVLKNFKVGAPIYKLNFDETNMQMIAGMYLMAIDNYRELLEEFVDKTNLNDDTILFFQPRHIIELVSIIKGMIDVSSINNDAWWLEYIKKYAKFITEINRYREYKNFIDTTDIFIDINKAEDRIKYILKEIIFLPYDKIDTLVRMGIDEFKKGTNTDDSEFNEDDGQSKV